MNQMNQNFFSYLIAPYSYEDFFQIYWEKRYLYIPRDCQLYYEQIIHNNDIDTLLQNHNLQADNDSFIIANKGKSLDYSFWAKKQSKSNQYIVDNNKLFDCLNQGNTVIINGAHKLIPKVVNFCNNLESELRFNVQTNIYITPPSSQGLSAHYDDHDVCILQTNGTKIWHLYHSPIQLPSQKKDDNIGQHLLGEPELSVELKPGDFLYIPRGLIHQALTTDTTSIHIALGLYPTYYFELLQDIVEIAQDNPAFRRAIPNNLSADYNSSNLEDEFRSLCKILIDEIDINSLINKRANNFIKEKRSDNTHRFNDWLELSNLNLNSILSRRKSIIFNVNKDNKKIFVEFYHKTLEFPIFLASSLNVILYSDSFQVKDIPGLINDEGRIKLITQLVQEGFLKIESI